MPVFARYRPTPRSTMAWTTARLIARAMPLIGIVAIAACNAQDPPRNEVLLKLREADKMLRSQQYDAAATLALEAGKGSKSDADLQQQSAMIAFLAGKVSDSLPLFDRANELDPVLRPHNWQRGVALGCAGKFEEGADQFKMHHDVNPDDVENSAWYFLCLAKTKGRAAAEAAVIPSRGDPRPPMMDVLNMLKGTISPDKVLVAAETGVAEGRARKQAKFYGFLYVGLYYDSIGEESKAISALDKCLAEAEPDYMGRTALHYRNLRFPTAKLPGPEGKEESSK